MKIHQISVFVILTLLAGHSARASDWETVASANAGRQANSLSSVAAVADNDVWAVASAFTQSLFAYRTLIEHWNGARSPLMMRPKLTKGQNRLNGVPVVPAKSGST